MQGYPHSGVPRHAEYLWERRDPNQCREVASADPAGKGDFLQACANPTQSSCRWRRHLSDRIRDLAEDAGGAPVKPAGRADPQGRTAKSICYNCRWTERKAKRLRPPLTILE